MRTHQPNELSAPDETAKRAHTLPLRGGQGTHGSLEPPSNPHTFEGVARAYDERTAAAFLAIDILTRAKTFDRLVGGVDEALTIAPHLPWEKAAQIHPDKHHGRCILDALELSRERMFDGLLN